MKIGASEKDVEEARQARALLASLGWSHKDLAEKSGLKRATVSNILTAMYAYECWPAKAAINAALGRDIFTKVKTSPPPKRAGRRPRDVTTATMTPQNTQG